jgi:hypothetical protein
MGSETGCKVALQEPQRPVSDRCFAATRLLAPHQLLPQFDRRRVAKKEMLIWL